MMRLCAAATFVLVLLCAAPARAASNCDPDGTQASGSIYRICMPDPADYNGMLVLWAHGFQDAGKAVNIPDDQLCSAISACRGPPRGSDSGSPPTATARPAGDSPGEGRHPRPRGDLQQQKGTPSKVYLVGASEGGLITALALEQHPDVFSAGIAACGPVGDFPDRSTTSATRGSPSIYFFPGLIPGDPFHPDPGLVATWGDFYTANVAPVAFDPANAAKLQQWVAVAKLPYDAADPAGSLAISVADALRYPVVNALDAAATLGGFPFDNTTRVCTKSGTTCLNLLVPRAAASPAAITDHVKHSSNTTSVLQRLRSSRCTRLHNRDGPVRSRADLCVNARVRGAHRASPANHDQSVRPATASSEVLRRFAVMLLNRRPRRVDHHRRVWPSEIAAFALKLRDLKLKK